MEMDLHLSEAMRLGALMGEKTKRDSWNHCALGIAATAVGIKHARDVRFFGIKIWLNDRPKALLKRWQWLSEECSCDQCQMYYSMYGRRKATMLWHVSDLYERYPERTVTDVALLVASIEPSCRCHRFNCSCDAQLADPERVTEEVFIPQEL